VGGPVNIREAVYGRLLDLTHLIPSISPWNVWDLPWSLWLGYAAMVDGWREAQRESGTQATRRLVDGWREAQREAARKHG